MPQACRVGDMANCPSDSHGNKCCPHNVTGPGIAGSGDVYANGMPMMRMGDMGVHSSCCGSNTWMIIGCSGTVFINGKGAARNGDTTQHCGGGGMVISGSSDVYMG